MQRDSLAVDSPHSMHETIAVGMLQQENPPGIVAADIEDDEIRPHTGRLLTKYNRNQAISNPKARPDPIGSQPISPSDRQSPRIQDCKHIFTKRKFIRDTR
jgi:hypothetical protein